MDRVTEVLIFALFENRLGFRNYLNCYQLSYYLYTKTFRSCPLYVSLKTLFFMSNIVPVTCKTLKLEHVNTARKSTRWGQSAVGNL